MRCMSEKEKHKEGWRERYKEQFGDLTLGTLAGAKGSPVFHNNELEVPRLLNFIESELATVREEAYKEGQESMSQAVWEATSKLQ